MTSHSAACGLLVLVACLLSAQCMTGVAGMMVKRSDDPVPLETVVDQLSTQLAQLQAQQLATRNQLDALTDQVRRHVSFWVQMSHDEDNTVPAPANGPYKYGQVNLNEGQGYDPVTGIFTAPYDGVYLLAAQIFMRGPQYGLIDIKVNGRIISRMGLDTRAAGTDPDDSDSTSVITRLSAGDKVWVESGTGAHWIVSDMHTFFTGTLLYSGPAAEE